MKKIFLAALILSFFFAGYYSIFLDSIPYEQEMGAFSWMESTRLSWTKLLSYSFNPISYSLMADDAYLIKVRVTEHLVLKFLYQLFGESMAVITAYQVFLAVVFALFILWFGFLCTGSVLAGFLSALFLLLTPAYGWTIMEYGDFAPLDQTLLIGFLIFFIYVFRKTISSGSTNVSKWAELAALWFLGMLAIRTKEPNLFLIPALSWLLVFSHLTRRLFKPDFKRELKRFLPLTFALVLLTLPTVLVRERAVSSGFPINRDFFAYQFYTFFYNPDAYAGEKRFALTSWNPFPSTIFANFGPILSWTFILIAFVLCIYRLRSKKPIFSPGVPVVLVLTAWILMTSAFNGANKGLYFTRYLTWALLPLTLLVSVVFTRFVSMLSEKKRRLFVGGLIVLAAIKIIGNVGHSLYLHKGLERIWVPKWIFKTAVYSDQTADPNPTLWEVLQYWNPRTDFTRATEPFIYHQNSREGIGRDSSLRELLTKYGLAYVGSDRPLDLPWSYKLIRTIDSSKLSSMTAWRSKFSKKKAPVYYLYRVSLEFKA